MDQVLFWERYKNACKDANVEPPKALRSQMGKATLEISKAETLTVNDWKPLLSTLAKDTSLHYLSLSASSTRYKVLESLIGERDVLRSRRNPALYSKYLLHWLSSSLSRNLTSSRCLSSLFLSKIPIKEGYINILSQGLARTRSLQHLAFHHCPVEDAGCSALCKALSSRSTLTTLDLTDCALTHVSAYELAQLIQRQYCTRVSEVWKGSLRYGEPAGDDMPGLRRITLNLNPNIGDRGIKHLTSALYDDIWIKGVDMQGCGIKEEGATSVANMLQQNHTITVFDLRCNPGVETVLPLVMSKLRGNLAQSKPGLYKCKWMEQVEPPSGRVSQMTLAHSVPSTISLPRSGSSVKSVSVEPPWMTKKLCRSKPSRSSPHLTKPTKVGRAQSLEGVMHKLQFVRANPCVAESQEDDSCNETEKADIEAEDVDSLDNVSSAYYRKPLISVSLENQTILLNFKEALARIRSGEEVVKMDRKESDRVGEGVVFVDVPPVCAASGGGDSQPVYSQTKLPPTLLLPEAGDAGSHMEERHLYKVKRHTSPRQPVNNWIDRTSEMNRELKRSCSQKSLVSKALLDEFDETSHPLHPSASFSNLSALRHS